MNVPTIRYMPAIIAFLGHDPYPEPRTFPERLLAVRRRLGLTRRQMAERFHIGPDQLAGFEQGKSEPKGPIREKIAKLLKRHLSQTSV